MRNYSFTIYYDFSTVVRIRLMTFIPLLSDKARTDVFRL